MKKALKITLWTLLGVVLLVAAVLIFVAATFDPNRYKPQVIQQVKDKTGRTLQLDGDIRLSFFPRIGAALGKATLSVPNGEQAFASFDDLRVSVALLPLLSRHVVVDGIDLINLHASVVKFKNGRTSIDDLSGAPAAAPVPARQEQGPLTVDIAHINIQNADIAYSDEAGGKQYELSKLDLKTGRIAPGVPGKIDLSLHISGAPELDLDAALSGMLTLDLEHQTYALADFDFKVYGTAAGIQKLDAHGQGSAGADLAGGNYTLAALKLDASGQQGGGPFTLKVDAPNLDISEQKVEARALAVEATADSGGGHLDVKLNLPAVAGNKQAFKADTWSGELQMTRQDMVVKTTVRGVLAGSVNDGRYVLTAIKADVHAENPRWPKTPVDATVTGQAQVDTHGGNAGLEFATHFDQSTISGRAGLTRFSPPFYTFDITADTLDLDRYRAKSAAPKPVAAASPLEFLISRAEAAGAADDAEQPLDLSFLEGLEASGSLKVGALKVSNVKASSVKVNLRAGGNRLQLDPISAGLYQGTLNGALSVTAGATPAITVRQSLAGVNVGPLLKDAADFETLEGHGNVSVDVNGRGATVSAIKKSLAGTASLRLTDGAIKGVNLAASIRGIKNKLREIQGEQVQAADATQKTDFSELSASFSLRDGVAHNSDLAGKSPLLRLGGEGDIDIGNSTLNYLLKATVVATSKGEGGKELADLKGLTLPDKLSGPFTAPQYHIDFSGIAASYAQAALEGKKDEVKAKLQDKLQEKMGDKLKGLKGLFGQ